MRFPQAAGLLLLDNVRRLHMADLVLSDPRAALPLESLAQLPALTALRLSGGNVWEGAVHPWPGFTEPDAALRVRGTAVARAEKRRTTLPPSAL